MNRDTTKLEQVVRILATQDGRLAGTAGHDAARDYLLAQIEAHELQGYHDLGSALTYRCGGTELTNLFGVLPGARPELEPVLLAAHYDTCGPLPGADDNAAAVAILLELVAPLRAAGLDRSVIFAFFDAEEPPHYLSAGMGSNWFYTHQRREQIHCALVLDLVGHDVPIPGWEDLLFVTGLESDPGLERVFVDRATRVQGIRTLPTLTRYIGDLSDYAAFRSDRRPFLFFSCAQWAHYHMPTDTPEKLNYDKIAATADYLLDLTGAVARADLNGPFEGHDTTATELACLQALGGPALAQLGIEPRSRADLDALIPQLVSLFLG